MNRSLSIGVNYQGTPQELYGCVNDADDWAKLLTRHGFSATVLAERMATRQAILDSMRRLVDSLAPGRVGVVTFSGHGTWVPDKDGDEPDGRDEALCPIDMGEDGRNLIIDDELAAVFAGVPADAHVLFITDCCHSGSVYRMLLGGPHVAGRRRVRFLPPSHFLRAGPLVSRMDLAFGQQKAKADPPMPGVVHFSGCKDSEYSTDANIDGRDCGAFSYFATKAFDAAAAAGGTYLDVFKAVRAKLPSVDFQQTPQFNAMPALKRHRVFG